MKRSGENLTCEVTDHILLTLKFRDYNHPVFHRVRCARGQRTALRRGATQRTMNIARTLSRSVNENAGIHSTRGRRNAEEKTCEMNLESSFVV
jgi:hypothetical protein